MIERLIVYPHVHKLAHSNEPEGIRKQIRYYFTSGRNLTAASSTESDKEPGVDGVDD